MLLHPSRPSPASSCPRPGLHRSVKTSTSRVTYLDSSAIVKLVVREPESAALRRYVRGRRLVSSALARAEVARAVMPLGEPASRRARDVLSRIDLVRINDRVLTLAGAMEPASLRTLDAVHLGTASLFGATLTRIVCYDERMSRAAAAGGWRVAAPA